MFHKKYKALAGSAAFSLVAAAAITIWYYSVVHRADGINPAVEDVPYKTITFKAEEGLKYHHFTGSNIDIPAGALQDKNGNTVTGEATILYREFHTPEDMMRADIPMGDVEVMSLQSAGMFEIKALQGEDELELTSGKNINVQLAAYRPSPGYDVFRLDEEYNWEATGKPQAMVNTAKFDSCAKLPVLPEEPVNPEAGENDIVVDIDADYAQYPQLKPFEKTRWKVIETKKSDPKGKNAWAFRVIWDKMRVRKDAASGGYVLEMSSTNREDYTKTVVRTFSLPVLPLLTGKALEDALAEYEQQYAEYEKMELLVSAEEDRLALEADAMNAFSINKMGIWNIDKAVEKDLLVKVHAKFEYSDPVNPFFNKIRVYVMNHDDNTVQEYDPLRKNELYLKEGSNTSLMAVLPDDKIAVFNSLDFKTVNFGNYARNGEAYRFHMKVYDADFVLGKDMMAMK